MKGNIRCIDGRSWRHDPQPDDPSLETELGKCPDCDGAGCEVLAKLDRLDGDHPGWREMRYPNGQRMWSDRGMMLDERGMRSIFDDVDE